MKVAFTSCFDAKSESVQPVWDAVREQDPNILLLLGDNIYMDYGLDLIFDKPRNWKDKKFAREMHKRYRLQAEVDSFKNLAASVDRIGLTWDDHDFAWNNCYVIGKKRRHKKKAVPLNKRLIAKGLQHQFSNWLQEASSTTPYPSQPSMAELLVGDDEGIEYYFDVDFVRFIMLDVRYYREKKNEKEPGTMLGQNQKTWLKNLVNSWDGVSIICTGSTLSRSGESWDNYLDYEWLMQQGFSKTMVLSGDIHKNAYVKHEGASRIVEATSSGAVRPPMSKGNFGLLDINPDRVEVSLFDDEGVQINRTVRF